MKNEDVRKLVSFKTVEKIKPIENADAIDWFVSAVGKL